MLIPIVSCSLKHKSVLTIIQIVTTDDYRELSPMYKSIVIVGVVVLHIAPAVDDKLRNTSLLIANNVYKTCTICV